MSPEEIDQRIAEARAYLEQPAAVTDVGERQRCWIVSLHAQRCPCPNCGHKLNVYEAASDPAAEFSGAHDGGPYRCSKCDRELKHVVPFMGPPWFWHLVPVKVVEDLP